jgi:hypothetical protein
MVRTIEAKASFGPDGALCVAYCLSGDMIRLRIPQTPSSKRTDGLWEHTCFEAFIGVRGETAYREFNFSPSGQWASYAFSDYRQGDESIQLPDAPQIIARLFAGRLELEATVSAKSLPPNASGMPWQVGLSAVVESADTVDGHHSYWALRHSSPQPDFHRRMSFSFEITAA